MRRRDFGREADRYCVLELRAALAGAEEPPDAPAEIADGVSAIRLATAAPLSAGPVLFETLDGRPFGIRPVLPIAATQPPGEPTRLDSFRATLAASCSAARARRRRHRARRGARPLGAVAVPERAVPLRAAARDVPGAARRDVAAAGGRPPRGRARRPVGAARGARRAGCGQTPPRPRSPTPHGGRSSRRFGTVTGRRSSASSTRRSSASRERRPLRAAV